MQPKTVHIITYASISRQFIFMQRPKVKGGVDFRRVFTLPTPSLTGRGGQFFTPGGNEGVGPQTEWGEGGPHTV